MEPGRADIAIQSPQFIDDTHATLASYYTNIAIPTAATFTMFFQIQLPTRSAGGLGHAPRREIITGTITTW